MQFNKTGPTKMEQYNLHEGQNEWPMTDDR